MTIVEKRDVAPGTTIEADLCIIGAGAAGIAIARALSGHGIEVAMLAGGGRDFRHKSQILYHGRNVGRESFAPGKARLRMFGGSTTRWAGQCRPLDPVDFEARAGLPNTGWPIGAETLAPYYRQAATVCDLDDWRFERPDFAGASFGPDADIAPVRYRHGHNVDFAQVFGADLDAARDVRVFFDLHAVEIVPDGDTVSHIEARGDDGRNVRVVADRFVLACGGMENARLLLASRSVQAEGVGNARDLVGRYFMDHPFFFGGSVQLADGVEPEAIGALKGYEQAGSAQRAHGAFAVSERLRREEALNGAGVFFVERAAHKSSPHFLSRGGVAMTRVIDVMMHRELPDGRLQRHIPALFTNAGDVTRSTTERVRGAFSKKRTFAARFTLEALPIPESRIRLDPKRRDRFGMPQLQVDWRLSDHDRGGIDRLRSGLVRWFDAAGIGKLSLHGATDREGFPVSMEGGKHHMGTTRMSSDPDNGVVDPDCRLHGTRNFYVAGSSVFPTGGYVNPTLTIVALALRLADHLKSEIGCGETEEAS
ncbi:GMC oxidoreductase [Tropicimonas marinistellae]|uniref:GMC oxidoreductase n=1 Tax=Tropicimonas marinistellae TaxID=1739787 RepID=UPI00082DCC32|nr:GMC family oxidoreductase [Tropicimonas marinistellae]